jgi:uncharacterized membrane protein YcaP (DUF421 family)
MSEMVIRATVVFWILWVLLRAAGKRELAEMTPFELIVLMVMGDLIQQGVTEEDMSLTGAALAVSTMLLWAVALSYMGFKSRRARDVLDSSPVIIVTNGKVDTEMLAVQRLSLEDVLDEARNAGIASLDEVRFGLLEAGGKMSFVRTDP